jgi:hypothetical protein
MTFKLVNENVEPLFCRPLHSYLHLVPHGRWVYNCSIQDYLPYYQHATKMKKFYKFEYLLLPRKSTKS